jgi:hypothetical protein
MTQTIGYYCDLCREKYVQHKCQDGLPCGHDKAEAIRVYAKSFGRGSERVEMFWLGGRVRMWICRKPKEENVFYIGLAGFYHGHQVETDDGQVTTVWKWLRQQEGKVIRAFLSRWESRKEPPDWRVIEITDYEGPEEVEEDVQEDNDQNH